MGEDNRWNTKVVEHKFRFDCNDNFLGIAIVVTAILAISFITGWSVQKHTDRTANLIKGGFRRVRIKSRGMEWVKGDDYNLKPTTDEIDAWSEEKKIYFVLKEKLQKEYDALKDKK